MSQLEKEIAIFKNRIQAVNNCLNDIPLMGPTSKKEARMIADILEDVEELGIQAIERRRVKK